MEKSYKSTTDFIYGKNSVLEALTRNPKRVGKVMFSQNINFDNRLKKIKELAKENNIQVQFTNLNKYQKHFEEQDGDNQRTNFQGVIASVASVEYTDFKDFLNIQKEGYKKVVILDGVCDPHNLGAIIRTLVAAGYDAIILPKHNSAPINATVEKTSVGAVNYIPIVKSNSLVATVEALKKNNYWIIAADGKSDDNYFDIDYKNMNFAIILGAEGKGVSKTLLNQADFKVKIPSNFESLNVSVSAGVIVYETIRQLHQK